MPRTSASDRQRLPPAYYSGFTFREEMTDAYEIKGKGGTLYGNPAVSNGLTISSTNTQGILYGGTSPFNGQTRMGVRMRWYQNNVNDTNFFLTQYDGGTTVQFAARPSAGTFAIFINEVYTNYASFAVTGACWYDLWIQYDGTATGGTLLERDNNRLKVWDISSGVPVPVTLTWVGVQGSVPAAFASPATPMMIGGYYSGSPVFLSGIGTIYSGVFLLPGGTLTDSEIADLATHSIVSLAGSYLRTTATGRESASDRVLIT